MLDPVLVEMRRQSKQKIEKLREKLLELSTERALLLDKGWYTHNTKSLKAFWSDSITLDQNSQTIYVGERSFVKFEDVFDRLRISTEDSMKQSQTKGWIVVLYAIARYEEEKSDKENMLILELLEYIREFRGKRDLWKFRNRGITKKSVSKTDCDTVNSILWKCDIERRIKLTKDGKEIIVTK